MPGKKKFPDLTGDGKVTKADILKGRGVPGFKHGGRVHRDPGQVEREMQAEAERRKERDRRFLEGTLFNNADFTDIEKSERRGDDKAVKKFGHGGDVCVGGGSDRTQGGRSAVRGTKFSGTY